MIIIAVIAVVATIVTAGAAAAALVPGMSLMEGITAVATGGLTLADEIVAGIAGGVRAIS